METGSDGVLLGDIRVSVAEIGVPVAEIGVSAVGDGMETGGLRMVMVRRRVIRWDG